MEQKNKSSEYDDIKEKLAENPILNKVIKGMIAWAILIMLGTTVWKMAEPVLNKNANINVASEASETATTIVEEKKPAKKEKSKKESSDISLPSGADRVQITANALNVRAEPDLKSDKVTTLSRGTIVQVVEDSGQWIKIRTAQGDIGYIKKSPELIKTAP